MIVKYKDYIEKCIPPSSVNEPKNTTRIAMVNGVRVRRAPKGFRTVNLTVTYSQQDLDSFWALWVALNSGVNSFELLLRIYGHTQPHEVRFIQSPTIRELGAGNYSVSVSLEIIDDLYSLGWGCPLYPYNNMYPSNTLYPC